MAAYYQTGVANNTTDLLAIIDEFIRNVVGGWTLVHYNPLEKINNSASESSHRTTYYYSHNNAYYWMACGVEGVSTDYRSYIQGGVISSVQATDTGLSPYAFDDQEGYLYYATANDFTGPYTKYHLFGGTEGTDGSYIYVVVEKTAGLFTHWGMGSLDRIGTIQGHFAVCMNWNYSTSYWRSVSNNRHQRMFDGWSSYNSGARGHLSLRQRVDIIFPAADQYIWGFDGSHVYGSTGGSLAQYLGEDSPNQYNGRAMLIPMWCHCDDRESPSWQRIVGLAPAHRFCRIDNLQPEDIVDTDWMVFPFKAKNAATGPTSSVYGLAYRWQDTQQT